MMNAKQIKFLTIFSKLSKCIDNMTESAFTTHFKSLLALDYTLACDAWEYFCTTLETESTKNSTCAHVLGEAVFNLFYDHAPSKCAKVIYDIPVIRRTVFQYNKKAFEGYGFSILVDTLMANKIAEGEELLKLLTKKSVKDYGKIMLALQDRIFIEILKKNPNKKIEMPKKLSTLLLTYIAKIKTSEKSMLEQRIREIL